MFQLNAKAAFFYTNLKVKRTGIDLLNFSTLDFNIQKVMILG